MLGRAQTLLVTIQAVDRALSGMAEPCWLLLNPQCRQGFWGWGTLPGGLHVSLTSRASKTCMLVCNE